MWLRMNRVPRIFSKRKPGESNAQRAQIYSTPTLSRPHNIGSGKHYKCCPLWGRIIEWKPQNILRRRLRRLRISRFLLFISLSNVASFDRDGSALAARYNEC